MSTRIEARMAELAGRHVPFVHATVVRAERPTSAHAGDDAIVLADGTIEGFVGGRCAEHSVRTAALDTLRAGRSVLLRVLPDDTDVFPDTDGARLAVNPCLSGGALEIFLRPRLPAPVLRVTGRTPVADAVAALATALELQVVRDGDDVPAGQPTAVVLATHGHGEEGAIRDALAAGVGYVGLVASRRRGAAVLDALGLTDAERSRVRTPAGLPLGAATPQEVALSIVAEVVRAIRVDGLTAPADHQTVHDHHQTTGHGDQTVHDHERGDGDAAAAGGGGGNPGGDHARFGGLLPLVVAEGVVDPVCGMTVVPADGVPRLEKDGVTHWFCATGCRDAFAARNA